MACACLSACFSSDSRALALFSNNAQASIPNGCCPPVEAAPRVRRRGDYTLVLLDPVLGGVSNECRASPGNTAADREWRMNYEM